MVPSLPRLSARSDLQDSSMTTHDPSERESNARVLLTEVSEHCYGIVKEIKLRRIGFIQNRLITTFRESVSSVGALEGREESQGRYLVALNLFEEFS